MSELKLDHCQARTWCWFDSNPTRLAIHGPCVCMGSAGEAGGNTLLVVIQRKVLLCRYRPDSDHRLTRSLSTLRIELAGRGTFAEMVRRMPSGAMISLLLDMRYCFCGAAHWS